jgi:hypothetical protein
MRTIHCRCPIHVLVMSRSTATLFRVLLWLQGGYYLVTAVWPILDIRSFQAVTGPKTDHIKTGREADHWLVMTVAVLILTIAMTLLLAAWRNSRIQEVAVLALTSAVGLTAIDVIYVSRGVIAPIYLVDAAAEVVLIVGWIAALRGRIAANDLR